MSDYRFSEAEKVAVWRGDTEKCLYCSIPIRYNDLQIDHIVPEGISESKFAELSPTLPPGFTINSIENWATCHQGCNVRKSSFVFDASASLYYIQMATRRAGKVREALEEFQVGRKNDRLLSTLRVRIEQGHLSRAAVLSALGNVQEPSGTQADPWVIAFGTNFLDPLPKDAPERDPELSDWLIERLERDLAATGAVFRRLDDERSGEGVSVRCAFWVFDLDRVMETVDPCWDVLAVQKYSELFQGSSDDLLDRAIVSRYHEVVHAAADDPVGISACPVCGSKELKYSSLATEEDIYYTAECRECGHRSSS